MGAYDKLAEFEDAGTVGDNAASTNIVDMEVVNSQIGVGGDVWLCIRTNTATTDALDSISIELQNDADDAFSDPTVIFAINATDTTELTMAAGTKFATNGAWILRCTLPYEVNERYLRLYYRSSTSNGSVVLDAWLQAEPPASDFGVQVIQSPVGNP